MYYLCTCFFIIFVLWNFNFSLLRFLARRCVELNGSHAEGVDLLLAIDLRHFRIFRNLFHWACVQLLKIELLFIFSVAGILLAPSPASSFVLGKLNPRPGGWKCRAKVNPRSNRSMPEPGRSLATCRRCWKMEKRRGCQQRPGRTRIAPSMSSKWLILT